MRLLAFILLSFFFPFAFIHSFIRSIAMALLVSYKSVT